MHIQALVLHALSLQQVSFRQAHDWVLSRLTLEVPLGATVCLTGANGIGKTTLLRLVATSLRPTRGTLTLFGQPAWPEPAALRPRIGLLTHDHQLYEQLSARENLAFLHGLMCPGEAEGPPAARPGGPLCIADALGRVGLAADADRPVRLYSAGMKRRLALAALLLCDPELMLLDEPFGQLDPAGVTLVFELIAAAQARGRTLVLSTHDLARGMQVATHHLHLRGPRQAASWRAL